ncbi:MAG: DEAD/DEAH box helicase family protein [Lactobacillales bacterium]|jgi:type I restriction enzyme R subunit|nr:DEAD/DEAH box helicase family protein [Lactobacillales bacterium]
MALENKEIRFEQDIESFLTSFDGGYQKEVFQDGGFDAERGIDLEKLVSFVKETQPKAWKRYETIYKGDAPEKLYKRFDDEVQSRGLLDVLRGGIKDRGVPLKFVYFKPGSRLNQEAMDNYRKNILTCTRQFAYSPNNRNTIDMVLSLNGIPLVAIELKNQFTNQSVEHAKKQFMYDRDARELSFQFNRRFLVYFAVDHYEAWMTTKLDGKKTYFLPFNQGSNGPGEVGGKGNPENTAGYATSYLWEQVLQKDSLMDILQRFMNLDDGKLIFPRFHQWHAVKKVEADILFNSTGKNYLIQHSAGSGKSNTIAWLAYHLSNAHDAADESIISTVIIVTDRTVLDRQLQNTITSFDHQPGLVETIGEGKSAQDLKNAINDGKKIIITTLQKFPVIFDQLDDIKERNFAVIVDEAHSSQTGSSAQKLKVALSDKTEALKEYQELEDEIEAKEVDSQDEMVNTLLAHGQHPNLSFFAFTATPKQVTLETFGQKQLDGKYKPFHIYSMRQAIDEGFILDVLQNYMTYNVSYKIAKEIEENPELPTSEATRAIARFESLHPYELAQKTQIMVEQFREVTKAAINGRAKAMVVTASRLHAVRYMKAFKEYIAEKGYADMDVLVAFSGEVDDDGASFTEPKLNIMKDGKSVKENQLKDVFHTPDFNVLIVAEKYQTGFDEPLLHTMFVDKKLRGVKAVQTLSRLNRTMQGKNDTFVLDFVNTQNEILEAFQPYYEETSLDHEIDVNIIYSLQMKLREFKIYNSADIEKVMAIYRAASKKQDERLLGRMSSALKPVVDRYNDLSDEVKYDFRASLRKFIKIYGYVTQLIRMLDMELLEESMFAKYLLSFLPAEKRANVDLSDKISLEYFKITKDFEGAIPLVKEDEDAGILENLNGAGSSLKAPNEDETLEEIIARVNGRFPEGFSDADRVILTSIVNGTLDDPDHKLEHMAKNNDSAMFVNDLYKKEFEKMTMKLYMENTSAYEKLFKDTEYYQFVMHQVAKVSYKELRSR